MEKSTKRKLIIGGSLLVVLGVGAYFLYDYLKKRKPKQNEQGVTTNFNQPTTGGNIPSGNISSDSENPFKNNAEVLAFQKYANQKGYSPKLVEDGIWGNKTKKAWNTLGAEYSKYVANAAATVAATIKVGDKTKAKKTTQAYYKDSSGKFKSYNYGGTNNNGKILVGEYAGQVQGFESGLALVKNYTLPMAYNRDETSFYLATGDLAKL